MKKGDILKHMLETNLERDEVFREEIEKFLVHSSASLDTSVN